MRKVIGLMCALSLVFGVSTVSAQESGTWDDEMNLFLQVPAEDEETAEMLFVKDSASSAEKIEYKGYRHRGLHKLYKTAVRNGLVDPEWRQKCGQREKCMSRASEDKCGPQASGGQAKCITRARTAKKKIEKLAKKYALLSGAKKKLKKKLKEYKEKEPVNKAERLERKKLKAAMALVKKDLRGVKKKCRASNKEYGVKIFKKLNAQEANN